MADDIDDLLNCIEKKMNTRVKPWDSDEDDDRKPSPLSNQSSLNSHRKRDPLDVSDILHDDDDDFDDSKLRSNSKPQKTKAVTAASSVMTAVASSAASTTAGSNMRKCVPVYMGGSECSNGLSTTANNRTCDKLRCTDCDFQVSSFDNVQWASNTNYLFLRNNMPDYDRVQSKLKPKKGFRAYACQCRWYTASDWTELSQTDIKWVCGKH